MANYSTSFSGTENPLSESGNWVNGASYGFNNCEKGLADDSATQIAFGASPGSPTYADSTALLTGTWGANQMVQGTVYAGTTGGISYPEVELRLRSALSGTNCTGYEITFSIGQGAAGYLEVVKWNGALGSFTYLVNNLTGSQYNVVTGDVIQAWMIGSIITVFKNGIFQVAVSDTTYASGNPGIGFDYTASGNHYGFSAFSAADGSNLVGLAQSPNGTTLASSGTTISLAYGSNVTAGNRLVVGLNKNTGSSSRTPAVGDISKSAGTCTLGSWTLDSSLQNQSSTDSTYESVALFSAPVTGAGSCTIQIALGATGFANICLFELYDSASTGIDSSNTGGNVTSGTEITSSFSSTTAGIIIGAVVNDVASGNITFTPQTNYVDAYDSHNANTNLTGGFVYQITNGAKSSQQPGFAAPTTYPFAACAAAYKVAGVGTTLSTTHATLSYAPEPLHPNLSMSTTHGALAYTPRTLLPNLRMSTTHATVAYTGQPLHVNIIMALTHAALSYVGKTVTIVTGVANVIINMICAALVYTGQALHLNISMPMIHASVNYTGQPVHVNSIMAMTHAALIYTAQVLHVNVVFGMVHAALTYTGQTLRVNQLMALTHATLSYVGKTLSPSNLLQLTCAVLSYTGQALHGLGVFIQITCATMAYVGKGLYGFGGNVINKVLYLTNSTRYTHRPKSRGM